MGPARLTLTLKDGQVLTGPVSTVEGKLEVQTAEAGQVTTAKPSRPFARRGRGCLSGRT
jgi:hypothetical protein